MKITIIENGPAIVEDEKHIEISSKNPVVSNTKFYICRCGKSKNGEFCDGSHKQTINQ